MSPALDKRRKDNQCAPSWRHKQIRIRLTVAESKRVERSKRSGSIPAPLPMWVPVRAGPGDDTGGGILARGDARAPA